MIGRSFRSELRPHVWGSGLSAAERRHFLPLVEGGIAKTEIEGEERGSTPTSNFFCISFPKREVGLCFVILDLDAMPLSCPERRGDLFRTYTLGLTLDHRS